MGTLIGSAAGVFFFQIMGPFFPNMAVAQDWSLGLLFGLGGSTDSNAAKKCNVLFPPD